MQPVPGSATDGIEPADNRRLRQQFRLAPGLAGRRDAASLLHGPRLSGRGRGQDLSPSRQQRVPRRGIVSPVRDHATRPDAGAKFNGIGAIRSLNFDWGPWPLDESATPDARSVEFGIDFLERSRDRPFFLAIGLFRPHMPFHVPPKYFASYPLDRVAMPRTPAGDLQDIPEGGQALLRQKQHFMKAIRDADAEHPGTWREAVRSYQASCTFADHQLGRLLDALARSEDARNTIVVLWSDHGYHLGEKNHWEKFVLWEKATRVPLVIAAPGTVGGGTEVSAPVSLLDLYPTLLDLAGLPPKPTLEGQSLTPLLRGSPPTADSVNDLSAEQSCRTVESVALHPLRRRHGGTLRPRQRSRRIEQSGGSRGVRRHDPQAAAGAPEAVSPESLRVALTAEATEPFQAADASRR